MGVRFTERLVKLMLRTKERFEAVVGERGSSPSSYVRSSLLERAAHDEGGAELRNAGA